MAGIKAFPPKVPLEAAKEAAAQAMLTVFSVIERAALEAVIKELDENDRYVAGPRSGLNTHPHLHECLRRH